MSEPWLKELMGIFKKEKINAKIVCADVGRTPFPDNSFDIITCSELLEHIVEPTEAITEIKRILKKGGVAVVSVPFEEKREFTICVHCYAKTPLYGHFHSFTEKKIRDLFETQGFEFLSMKQVRSVLPIRFYDYLPYFIWFPLDFVLQKLVGRKPNWIVLKVKKND